MIILSVNVRQAHVTFRPIDAVRGACSDGNATEFKAYGALNFTQTPFAGMGCASRRTSESQRSL
jgi:hypothetical protein